MAELVEVVDWICVGGDVLRHRYLSKWAEGLPLEQLCVSVSSGPEGIVMAIRQALEAGEHAAGWDEINAFNTLCRQGMLDDIAAHAPEGLAYAAYCYAGEVPLAAPSALAEAGYVLLTSSDGTQQGDVLSMLFFALSLARATRATYSAVDRCIQAHPEVFGPPARRRQARSGERQAFGV